jgi:heme ABC exporter ATP-binding subunit CcmA
MRDATSILSIARRMLHRTSHPEIVDRNFAPPVEVTELTIVRDRVRVLTEIDLVLQQGEVVAVMGANGAGKSTLLKYLAGAVRPMRGTIRWRGHRNVLKVAVHREIGFAGHECGLYLELTALENLLFAARMHGVADALVVAHNLLIDAGLEWAADRTVGKLSQGVCRRLAISRALVHTPSLILLDEPFAGLDAEGTAWLERLIQHWRRPGQAVCFTSHDSSQCERLADRIVLLHRGSIVPHQSTDAFRQPAIRSA